MGITKATPFNSSSKIKIEIIPLNLTRLLTSNASLKKMTNMRNKIYSLFQCRLEGDGLLPKEWSF